MKTHTHVALAASFVLQGLACAAPLEDVGSKAQVTLPYSEVKSLLEAARPRAEPPQPPIATAIASADISLDIVHATATAAFEVDVFASGWQLVPLIGTPFVLKTATSPGATVLVKDGMLCLLAKEPGHIPVALAFDIPAALVQPGASDLALKVTPAAAGQLTIAALPAHIRAVLQGSSSQSTNGSLPIPANGGEISLRLVEDKPAVVTPWASDTQTVIVQRDDRLAVKCRVHLTGDSGSGLSAIVELPPSAMDVHIGGPDLQPVRFQSNRTAALAWNTADVLDREIGIDFELPSPDSGEPWTFQNPRISKSTRAAARTILIPQPGAILSSTSGRLLDSSKSLPPWLDSAIAATGALEVSGTGPFTVETRILPRLEADTARIPRAEFHTRLVPDGAQLCEAQIQFQHRGPLRWRFSLPEGSELLSCTVDGRAVNPLVVGKELLELAIGGETSSRVNLSYTARGTSFAPVEGKLALALPSTPLFIEELTWGLALPDGYETTAFEGNVEPVAGGAETNFRKRLVRNDAAAVEIYYRKRDTNR